MSRHSDYHVRLTRISVELDRFGRMYPVVWFEPVYHNGSIFNSASLRTMDDVYRHDYVVGDIAHLRIIGSCPVIGQVITRSPSGPRLVESVNFGYCSPCQQKTVLRSGHYYCPDPMCPLLTFSRGVYAIREDVLNLPLRKLLHTFLRDELTSDIPSLLFLDHEQLLESGCYTHNESLKTASILRERVCQLFGTDVDVRYDVQDRVLNALSLTGLFTKDRRILLENLYRGKWEWGRLPEILTDRSFLRSCGFESRDARIVSQHAQSRIEELDSLARDF